MEDGRRTRRQGERDLPAPGGGAAAEPGRSRRLTGRLFGAGHAGGEVSGRGIGQLPGERVENGRDNGRQATAQLVEQDRVGRLEGTPRLEAAFEMRANRIAEKGGERERFAAASLDFPEDDPGA